MNQEFYAANPRVLMDEIRRQMDNLLRCNFGISYLDDALLGLFPREITLVGARSGAGKTELGALILQTQETRARTTLYFALDHEFREIEHRILWKNLCARLRKDHLDFVRSRSLRYSDWRAGRYSECEPVMRLLANENFAVDSVLRCCDAQLVYRRGDMTAEEICEISTTPGVGLVIIDHFHALRFDGDRFQSQRDAMERFAVLAEQIERPVLILGQFRKGGGVRPPLPTFEEFSGPGELYYIPQNIVMLAASHEKSASIGSTYFHIDKSRRASDSTSYVGIHAFDTSSKAYSPQYSVRRYRPFSEPEELRPLEIPKWAHRAVKPEAYNRPEMQPQRDWMDA